MLSYQDSNLDRQNQKLQCYHYTIRQSLKPQKALPHPISEGVFLEAMQNYKKFLIPTRGVFSFRFSAISDYKLKTDI